MKNSKTLILIDGHALAFRQFYALERTNMHTKDGVDTWAVYGFFKAIFDLLNNKKIKLDSIAVTFDVGRDTFRVEKFKEYKAQREAMPDSLRSQLGLIIEGLKAFNIPIYTKKGFEADDVIGTISKKATELGHKTFILTGDQDSFQLIDRDGFVKVLIPSKGELIEYDWEKVYEKLGVYPNQVTDYKGLRGDTSDNIPGIKGIGEKTAQKLLARYPHLEDLLADCENIPENSIRNKVCEGREIAILSKDLATIVTDVEIDFDFDKTNIELPNVNEVISFLKSLQFYKFIENLENILAIFDKDIDKKTENKIEAKDEVVVEQQQEGQLSLFQNLISEAESVANLEFEKNLISTEVEFENLVIELKKQEKIAIKVYSDFKNAVESELVGASFAFGNKAFYVPISHQVGEQLDKAFLLKVLKPVFESENIKKIMFDTKENINILKKEGIFLGGVESDVLLAGYIKNPSKKPELSIQAIDCINFIASKSPIESKKQKIAQISPINFLNFATDEVYSILKLNEYWSEHLSSEELKLLYEIEIPLTFVLAQMEYDGVSLDIEYLKNLSSEMSGYLKDLEMKIFEIAGGEFNLNSPKQVGEILFEKLNIKSKKKTKSKNLSTSIEVLEELAKDYKICEYLIQHRKYSKLKSTYTDALPQLISKKDNRIHTTYNQALTTTGRLSSSNPNLQNIPIRTSEGNKLRQAFVAEDREDIILSADYSQIELRLLAHVSDDENLIKAFNSGIDVHTLTASKVFGVKVEDVTKEMRYKSKAVNFGIIYGQTRYGLAKGLNITPFEAQDFIDKYFKTYPKVKAYMENTVEFAYKYGFVETIFGRKRYLEAELNSPNRMIKEFAQRAAINQPLQGTAADLIKKAMIDVSQKLTELSLKSKMIIQVHDELVFEVVKDELEVLKDLVVTSMELNQPLKVPLIIDVNWGKSWKE